MIGNIRESRDIVHTRGSGRDADAPSHLRLGAVLHERVEVWCAVKVRMSEGLT